MASPDAGAPFRRVARADLNVLIGGFETRRKRPPRKHPLAATSLVLDQAGERAHLGFAGGEVCSMRVVQGTTPDGDVRSRFVVEDVTRAQDAVASSSTSRETEASEENDSSTNLNFAIHQLCFVPTFRCVVARAEAGVTVHYHGVEGEGEGESTRVFCIPNSRNASAIAVDTTGTHSTQIAVVCPERKKKVVVYEIPEYPKLKQLDRFGKENTGIASPKENGLFRVAYERILGSAYPARTASWHAGTLVVGTPRGVVCVSLLDGLAEPLPGAHGDASRRTENLDSRRKKLLDKSRLVLAGLGPIRPNDEAYDTMFGGGVYGDGDDDDGGRAESNPVHPAIAAAPNGVLALAPTGELLRAWLDCDETRDGGGGETEKRASLALGAPAVETPISLTCAFPFAVLVSKSATVATVVDCVGTAPEDNYCVSFCVSGNACNGKHDVQNETQNALLVAGAPIGPALGRGDDVGNELCVSSFSCPASSSALVAVRGGLVEMHRRRSTRERVVALLVALRIEGTFWGFPKSRTTVSPTTDTFLYKKKEAVSLADARGRDVGDEWKHENGLRCGRSSFAIHMRAEAGFLAVARLDFEYAVSLWRSVGDAVQIAELLPYFTRQAGSKTAFRGAVAANKVSAGSENTECGFVSRLGARERFAAVGGTPIVCDLETVFACALRSVLPVSTLEKKLLSAKKTLVEYLEKRPLANGDALKRRGDTLVLVLWAETGNVTKLERALGGTVDGVEKGTELVAAQMYARDVDVAVLGPVLVTRGRFFARALLFAKLEKDDDQALETYAGLARGALTEALCEPGFGGAGCGAEPVSHTCAQLASALIRERCRDDLRGLHRPSDEAVARWTRRHVSWILETSPSDGVETLGVPRVMRSVDCEFALAMCATAKATQTVVWQVLKNRIAPFAPDRQNESAHTAFAVATWRAWDDENENENGQSGDTTCVASPASLLAFLLKKPIRFDAQRTLQAIDPDQLSSSSARGLLALGLVHGARVAPRSLPKKFSQFVFALAELRGAVGDHVAAYRLLTEVAMAEAAADAYVERLGETAVAAKEKVIEILGRPNRGTDKEQAAPTFSLRGKQYL